jgi:RNA polymerase sigma factor (sigma-70 family)
MNPSQVAQRLSGETGRSRETIRYTLWNHDRDHHSTPIFESWREPLTRKQVDAIVEAFKAGASVTELARRFDRKPSAIYQILRLGRARRLLTRRFEYVPHPQFLSKTADEEVLGLNVVHEPSSGNPAQGPLDVEDPATGTCSIYGPQLLTREEEAGLFLRYNYLKFKAVRLQAQLAVGYAPRRTMDELERLLGETERIRERLVHAYLRLVVSVARRHQAKNASLHDLVSEGNVCLLRALEKFDISRGNRFSTYLTWALLKTFARTVPEAIRESATFVTGYEGLLESAGAREEAEEPVEDGEVRRRAVTGLLSRLSSREREVVASRFGLSEANAASYGEIGKRLGVSKERARQIQNAAIRKLKEQLARDGSKQG